eukprot:3717565-Rhodomonas_salina.2
MEHGSLQAPGTCAGQPHWLRLLLLFLPLLIVILSSHPLLLLLAQRAPGRDLYFNVNVSQPRRFTSSCVHGSGEDADRDDAARRWDEGREDLSGRRDVLKRKLRHRLERCVQELAPAPPHYHT